MKFKGWMQADGILTVHTPDQAGYRGLSGLKVKIPLADKFPCPRGEMDRRGLPKIRNWGIRASKDQVCPCQRDLGSQDRGYFPTGKSHTPLKGRG